MSEPRVQRLGPGDDAYPSLLSVIASPPALDVRGQLEAADALAVTIVGTRRATPYGLGVAERLAFDLAERGVTIVSGLARGIDTAAHRGALAAGGRTLAVLGSGVDVIYPPDNRRLAAEIERRGALISQFARGMPPRPGHFPARNRTLAGLALAVVVVEASERSGALITAGFAGDLGRDVFAVPGPITASSSRGTNRLLQDGAMLVQDWMDIVKEFPEPWRRAVRASQPATRIGGPEAETDEGRVLALLSVEAPLHIEALIARSACAPTRTAAALVALELGGWARQLEGQRWVAVATRVGRG